MEITLQHNLNKNVDPLVAFRFLVEVDGDVVGSFMQFSGIKMEVQTIQARGGNDIRGVQEYIPVLTTFEPVTLTRGVFANNKFMNWLKRVEAFILSLTDKDGKPVPVILRPWHEYNGG